MHASGRRTNNRGGVVGTELTLYWTVSLRSGMLITATWAVMQHMDEKYVTRSTSVAWLTSVYHRSGYHRSSAKITDFTSLTTSLRPLSRSGQRRALGSTS